MSMYKHLYIYIYYIIHIHVYVLKYNIYIYMSVYSNKTSESLAIPQFPDFTKKAVPPRFDQGPKSFASRATPRV